MLLDQVAFVLALEVRAPVNRILELTSVLDGCFQDIHGLGIGNALEGDAQHAAQALDETVVVFVVEELQVVHAVVQGVLDQVFYEFLGQDHVVFQLVEGHFRFNHPELGQVAGCIGILGAEGRTEGVDFTHGRGTQFAFQLAADGQGSLLAEEILAEIHFAVVLGHVLEVHRGHLEHIACTFGVAFGDERGIQIDEALVVEELVDGEGHGVTDAEHGTEGIRAQAHVGDAAQVLQRCILLLQGIAHGIALAIDFNAGGLDFHGLAAAHGLDEFAGHFQAGSGGDAFHQFLVEHAHVGYDLDIVDGGTVVEGDEFDLFVASLCPDPSFGEDIGPCRHFQQVLDFCSSECIHFSVYLQLLGGVILRKDTEYADKYKTDRKKRKARVR